MAVLILAELFEVSALTLVLLVLVAFAAGWVDAVVGGGGLIQLRRLLIGLPDSTPPAAILGTNKISSVWGTATSSILYAIKVRPDWRTIAPLVVASGCRLGAGRAAGAIPAQGGLHPDRAGRPDRRGIYIWRRPELGLVSARKHDGRAHYGRTAAIGLGVGAYDGFLGPGTGSFFVILLVGVLGYGFLEASRQGQDRQPGDEPVGDRRLRRVRVDAVGARADHGRGQPGRRLLGARTAISRGNSFVRKVFLLVLAGLIIKLAYDTAAQLLALMLQPGQVWSGAPQERARSVVLASWVSAADRSRFAGRSQPQPAERLERGVHLQDQLAGVAASRGTTDRHVRRLGRRHLGLASARARRSAGRGRSGARAARGPPGRAGC